MIPRLLHKTPVYIRQIDRTFTAVVDDDLREVVGQVRRKQKPIKLIAQVKIGDTNSPQASEGGVTESSAGYLLFLTSDLRNAKVVLRRGDQVVQIGDAPNDRETDYYLSKTEWRGHYTQRKGPTLVKWYFLDREPSRHRGAL